MNKEMQFINENRAGFLATVDENGKPRIRGWQVMDVEENRIILSTSNKKKVFRQLKETPLAEWLSMSKNTQTLRVNAEVVFENDVTIRQNLIDNSPIIKKLYAGRLEEIEFFYLENLEFDWFEFSMPNSK